MSRRPAARARTAAVTSATRPRRRRALRLPTLRVAARGRVRRWRRSLAARCAQRATIESGGRVAVQHAVARPAVLAQLPGVDVEPDDGCGRVDPALPQIRVTELAAHDDHQRRRLRRGRYFRAAQPHRRAHATAGASSYEHALAVDGASIDRRAQTSRPTPAADLTASRPRRPRRSADVRCRRSARPLPTRTASTGAIAGSRTRSRRTGFPPTAVSSTSSGTSTCTGRGLPAANANANASATAAAASSGRADPAAPRDDADPSRPWRPSSRAACPASHAVRAGAASAEMISSARDSAHDVPAAAATLSRPGPDVVIDHAGSSRHPRRGRRPRTRRRARGAGSRTGCRSG